jgi:hypothetical protein
MYFYCVEATLSNPFDDPVGPADSGWLVMPCLALCAIEAATTTTKVMRWSDSGYRTRATDPGGVIAYPPSVVEAFKVDVSANLDPTKSAVAAAWGTLTFNNLDNGLDATVAAWNSDGQPVRVLRGLKVLEASGPLVTRATTGTYIGSDGALHTAAPLVVRQDYSSGTGVLLNEPAATNLLTHSLDFSATAWAYTAVLASTDGTLGPDGVTLAQKLLPGGGFTPHYLTQQNAGVANIPNTLSVFVKNAAGTNNYLVLVQTEQAAMGNAVAANFSLASGTIGTVTDTGVQGSGSGLSAGVVPLGNGWYRCWLRGVAGVGSGSVISYVAMSLSSTGGIPLSTFSGGSSNQFYIFGAQLEAGSLTSFIPTVAAPASRAADGLYQGRQIMVDPPYASLVPVFVGVMGPWQVTPTTVDVALRDASYYLERLVPRTLYGGAGGLDGEVGLAGRPKPLGLGGPLNSVIKNVTPVLVDASNLIYQLQDGPCPAIGPIYDGGYAGYGALGNVADLYSGVTTAGNYRTCLAKGLFQVGTTPTFGITADFVALGATLSRTDQLLRYVLATLMTVPLNAIGSADGVAIDDIGPDPAVTGRAMALGAVVYLSPDDAVDGVTLISRILQPSGGLLVPSKDGALRAYVPTAIPGGATPVLSLDDTTILTIVPDNLPNTVDPSPWRLRVAWDRNWTVETSSLAGATPPARVTWLSQPFRSVSAVASPSALLQMARPSDPPVIGQDGGVTDQGTGGADVRAVAADMINLWGPKRRLYSVTVPHFLSDGLDWGSIVKVKSSFDGLNAGKLGQIAGWSYSSNDATATLKVLV